MLARRDEDGVKSYKKAKRFPAGRAIPWAWQTITGTAKTKAAFVPYSWNKEKSASRWAALDFDSHDGDAERAQRLAFAAFQQLIDTDFFVMLETSGSGGWHVWLVAQDFRPVNDWIRLLKKVTRSIGVLPTSGLCEIFPPDSICRNIGKGLPAPGSWNPSTDTFSEILYHNLDPLLDRLSKSAPEKQKPRFSSKTESPVKSHSPFCGEGSTRRS